MTALDRLRSASGRYKTLCPAPCGDLRAALDAIACLHDLVAEIEARHYTDDAGTDLQRKLAFTKTKACLARLETL